MRKLGAPNIVTLLWLVLVDRLPPEDYEPN